MPRKVSRKKTPPEPTITIKDVCDAFAVSPDAHHLLFRIVQMSGQGQREVLVAFPESQYFLGLPPKELASAFEELKSRGIVDVKSGYLPETPFIDLFKFMWMEFNFPEDMVPVEYGFLKITYNRPSVLQKTKELMEAKLNAAMEAVESQESPEAKSDGWVYLLKVGKFYKIGKTIDLKSRMTQLKIQLPQKPDVVHTIQTNDIHWLERHWHHHFAAKRANGEWFGLKPDDVVEFTSVEEMNVRVSKITKEANSDGNKKESSVQPGLDF